MLLEDENKVLDEEVQDEETEEVSSFSNFSSSNNIQVYLLY